MILSKNVTVILNPSNIKHYESLGYVIPRYRDKFYRLKVKKGTQIEISVSDLMKGTSKVRILCQCDICGKENLIIYNTIKDKYICQKCNNNLPEFRNNQIQKISGNKNINWKGGFPHCQNCGKELKNRNSHFCEACSYNQRKGTNAHNWNFNLTETERKIKHRISGINKWRKQVKERDDYTCQKCGSHEHLQVHHINNFANFKEQRIDPNNGITLCFKCHKGKKTSIHSIFGSFTDRKILNEFLKL